MFFFLLKKSLQMHMLDISSGLLNFSLDSFYSTEVVSKLRQKEQTQRFY